MSILASVGLSGQESDDDLQEIAWQMFALGHPVEAYRKDPERFWKFFHERFPDISRETVEKTVRQLEAEQ